MDRGRVCAPCPPVPLSLLPAGEFLSERAKRNQKPALLPAGAGKSYGLSGPAPTGGVLSLAPEKVPKERVQGENPLDTPRSVALRSSLSGVLDSRLRRFPRRPPASCIRMLRHLHPRAAWPGEMGPPQKPSAAVFVGRGAAAEWMSFRQRRKRRIWSLWRRGERRSKGAGGVFAVLGRKRS